MERPSALPLIVHLDEKDWIELSRGYYGIDPSFTSASEAVVRAAEIGRAMFPLSIVHFSETIRNLNQERRMRLARFMVAVSKGWTIAPPITFIKWEIENACRKLVGIPQYNLVGLLIRKGVSNLLGARGEIRVKDPNSSTISQDQIQQILEKIESPETLLWLLQNGFAQSHLQRIRRRAEVYAEEIERTRSQLYRVPDKKERHKRAKGMHFVKDYIAQKVVVFMLSHGMNPDFAELLGDPDKVTQFLKSMPVSNCLFELSFFRDMQRQRRVQPNDLNDITSLSVALSYCDVVLTEPMWQAVINSRNLDKLRPSKVMRSAIQLAPILSEL
jgi:hypothetical protein